MLEDTCSTVVPAATPSVSSDPVLLEDIEIDEHLKDRETSSMQGKKYVNEKKENLGKDITHTKGTDEQYCANFTGRLSAWLPELRKR